MTSPRPRNVGKATTYIRPDKVLETGKGGDGKEALDGERRPEKEGREDSARPSENCAWEKNWKRVDSVQGAHTKLGGEILKKTCRARFGGGKGEDSAKGRR